MNSTFMITLLSPNAKIVSLIPAKSSISMIKFNQKKGRSIFSRQHIATKTMSTMQDRRTKTGRKSISHIINNEGKTYTFSPIFITSCLSLTNKSSKSSKHSSGKSTSKSSKKRKRA